MLVSCANVDRWIDCVEALTADVGSSESSVNLLLHLKDIRAEFNRGKYLSLLARKDIAPMVHVTVPFDITKAVLDLESLISNSASLVEMYDQTVAYLSDQEGGVCLEVPASCTMDMWMELIHDLPEYTPATLLKYFYNKATQAAVAV